MVDTAVCKFCKNTLSAKSKGGTGHLRRHMETCLTKHGPQDPTQTQLSRYGSGSSGITSFRYSQQNMREGLAWYIATVEQPLTFAEDERLINFLQSCSKGFSESEGSRGSPDFWFLFEWVLWMISGRERKGIALQDTEKWLWIKYVEIPWNLLLKACIKAKDYEMVHELLERIQLCCGFIDSYSICDILNSCLNPILLNVGTQAQAYMTKRGLISHPAVGNCLININSRCGKIDDADLAFKSTPEKNSLSWTFIISARVNHGHPSEALDLFKDKQWRYTSMNPTTFRSALKAYALMGLVGEAYRLFLSMEEVYHIEPSEEHYSIMVEALGRAGMFEEVLEFIKGIVPGKLCPLIWRTLLLSSRVHGDMKLAKYALDKLLELDPGDFSNAQAGVL
ncbi:pentatricopeptide repeat-containing protein At4g14820-like [Citrus clementina]|uniref:pentatricopeptide repeat-containing protein At4g14820-like n=1 Tax=Citrus clementina TaxID=85681 RepID=UPI000CED0AE7|nr:pentatricopeptide repeat-containing protein At4g14820-like [Citrus x clementina]